MAIKTIIAKGMLNNFRTYNRVGVPANTRKGMYANYPYNTIIPVGNTTSGHNQYYNDPFIKSVDNQDNVLNQEVPYNIISFHSPDTSFRNPYLATPELKLYGHLAGTATQRFIEPQGHPKFKLMTNDALWMIIISGIADALLRSIGKKQINYPLGSFENAYASNWAVLGGAGGPAAALPVPLGGLNITGDGIANFYDINWNLGTLTSRLNFFNYVNNGGFLADSFSGLEGAGLAARANNLDSLTNGGIFNTNSYTADLSGYSMLPSWAQALASSVSGISQIAFFFLEGASTTADLMYAFAPYRQYALQLIGHGLYDKFVPFNVNDTKRFKIQESFYMSTNVSQEINDYLNTNTNTIDSFTINNYKRPKLVVLRTDRANTPTTEGPKLLINGIVGEDQSLGSLGMFDDYFEALSTTNNQIGPRINEKKKAMSLILI